MVFTDVYPTESSTVAHEDYNQIDFISIWEWLKMIDWFYWFPYIIIFFIVIIILFLFWYFFKK